MAPKRSHFTPETSRIVLDVVRYLKASGFVIDQPGRGNQFIPPQAPIYIRNDSGETMPAFGCGQVTGTVEYGGQNFVKIDKPVDDSGSAGGYLFCGIAPIANGEYGIAHDGPFVRMLTDGSTVTCGDGWQPDIGEWAVIPGGSMFSAVGEDDIATDVMRAFYLPTGGGGTIEYTITSLSTATSGPYDGLVIAAVVVRVADQTALIGTTVNVVDHSGCIFDVESMAGYTGWAAWGAAWSLDPEEDCETLTPKHWFAINRCCAANSGTYADECA